MEAFSQPVGALIAQRRSVRTYDAQPLPPDIKRRLTEYMRQTEGPKGSRVRLEWIESAGGNGKLGTYGIIRGAVQFLIAAAPKADRDALLDIGFRLEQTALFAVSLGLGTVWLGGTFSRGNFAKAAALSAEEILPIVMPVGVPAQKPALHERLMRAAAGSDRRRAWDELFFDAVSGHSLLPADAGAYADALSAVRLAPSANNSQPWRVFRLPEGYAFYQTAEAAQLGFDMHRIDMGIAMNHFELAAREAGLDGAWSFTPPAGDPAVPESCRFTATWLTA